jgi:hypothetical protein
MNQLSNTGRLPCFGHWPPFVAAEPKRSAVVPHPAIFEGHETAFRRVGRIFWRSEQ